MIIKFILFIYLGVVSYITGYSQILYTKQDSLNNNFYSVSEEIGGNNLLITNVKKTIAQNGNFSINTQLLRLSTSGLLFDSLQIDTNFSTFGQTLVANNSYYVYGVKYLGTNINSVTSIPTIINYDANFNIIKQTTFNAYNGMTVGLSQTTVLKNNRIYLFFPQQTNIKCYKIDFNLNKLDSAEFNGTALYDAINYGSNLLVCGTGFQYPSPMGRLQIHELDTTFNYVSHFNTDSLTYITAGATSQPGSGCSSQIGLLPMRGRLFEVSNNTYAISGYFPVEYNSACQNDDQNIISVIRNNKLVVKTNILGKQNGVQETNNYFANTAKKYNYLFTVSKSYSSANNPTTPQNIETEIMVSKVDSSGAVLWNNFFSTTDYFYDPYGISGTSDSGVVVCGLRYNITSPTVVGICEGFVMKIDKNGNQVFVSIPEQSINIFDVSIFPNPASDLTSLVFSTNISETISVKIINTIGQVVYNESLSNLSAENHVVNFNAENWASGIYNINISTNNGTTNRKLVIAK